MKAKARAIDGDNQFLNPTKSLIEPLSARLLTEGNQYEVHSIALFKGCLYFQVVNDLSRPAWCEAALFDITDTSIPPDWICNVFDAEPSLIVGAAFIAKDIPSYNAMVDRDIKAMNQFRSRVDWLFKQRIDRFLECVSEKLPLDVFEDVRELLRLEEKEYALETICQELIDGGSLDLEECEKCIELGKSLKLDEAETIRWDFWKNLLNYKEELQKGK